MSTKRNKSFLVTVIALATLAVSAAEPEKPPKYDARPVFYGNQAPSRVEVGGTYVKPVKPPKPPKYEAASSFQKPEKPPKPPKFQGTTDFHKPDKPPKPPKLEAGPNQIVAPDM